MTDELKEVLEEMCRYVGTTLHSLNLQTDARGVTHWPFEEYTWSSAAEACFRGWLEERLKDKRMWRALAKSSSNRKSNRAAFAREFVLFYGWRVENE